MESNPLVSIIIPTWNRADLLSETLESINNQSYTNWECVIVDDGSTDHTKTVVQRFKEINSNFIYYSRPDSSPKGANACRNFGFKKSKGSYINWFDSDDIMHPDKLKIQVKHLLNYNFPFTVCQTLVFEESINKTLGLRCEKIYSENFFNDFISNKIKWLTQAPLFKRKFMEENELLFDESLVQSQEREFFIRVLDLVDNYHYDNTPLVYFRKHEQSISHSGISIEKIKSNFKVNIQTLENYYERLGNTEIKVLIKGIKQALKMSLRLREFRLSHEIEERLYPYLSTLDRIKLYFGILSLRIFKRGDLFFK